MTKRAVTLETRNCLQPAACAGRKGLEAKTEGEAVGVERRTALILSVEKQEGAGAEYGMHYWALSNSRLRDVGRREPAIGAGASSPKRYRDAELLQFCLLRDSGRRSLRTRCVLNALRDRMRLTSHPQPPAVCPLGATSYGPAAPVDSRGRCSRACRDIAVAGPACDTAIGVRRGREQDVAGRWM